MTLQGEFGDHPPPRPSGPRVAGGWRFRPALDDWRPTGGRRLKLGHYLRLTPSAERDLEEIELHIAADNPNAAIDTVLRVIDSLQYLSGHPNMGREGRIDGTREWVVPETTFIAAYRIRDNTVEVLRVLHGARKWPQRL